MESNENQQKVTPPEKTPEQLLEEHGAQVAKQYMATLRQAANPHYMRGFCAQMLKECAQ